MAQEIKAVSRLRTILGFSRFLENPVSIIDETMQEMGDTYKAFIGITTKTVMSQDPKIIQHVLQKNHKNYYKSKLQTENLAKYTGKGLLTINGDHWLRQRRLIQPGFHKKKLEALTSIVNQEVQLYCDQLSAKIKHGEHEIDIAEDMLELSLNAVTKSLFSTGMGEKRLRFFEHSVNKLQRAIVKDVRQPMFNWWRALNGTNKENRKLADKTYELIYDLINERKKMSKRHDDLLDMLIESRYEGSDMGMSIEQLKDEVLILFLAGHETTSNALTWTFYCLDQNPHILSRVMHELDQLDDHEMNFEALRALPYTTQVINESMRLYPPVWIIDRIALEKDEFHGLTMNKGDMIGLYNWGAHRNAKYWKEPLKFDPDRFAPENKSKIVAFSFFPFGGGPRLCIGQQFAMMEMQITLFHMLKKFNFKLKPRHPVEIEPLVTVRPKYGMKMLVKQRS